MQLLISLIGVFIIIAGVGLPLLRMRPAAVTKRPLGRVELVGQPVAAAAWLLAVFVFFVLPSWLALAWVVGLLGLGLVVFCAIVLWPRTLPAAEAPSGTPAAPRGAVWKLAGNVVLIVALVFVVVAPLLLR